jgi:deazaflavin-dependent oxidoreductase (nitroreductase family)
VTSVAHAAEVLDAHRADAVCYLQTIGRTSGQRRTIEIWFSTDGERLFLLSGGRDRAHWVRNLRANPRVRVRVGGRSLNGTARIIEGQERDQAAREMLAAKYQGWTPSRPLSAWASTSLPVEVTFG